MLRMVLAALSVPLTLCLLIALHIAFVPAYSAAFRIDDIKATIRLNFYSLWSEAQSNSGRYLAVHSNKGMLVHEICGFDWAHRARTSVYLTKGDKIVVLGSENGCDAVFDPASRSVSQDLSLIHI